MPRNFIKWEEPCPTPEAPSLYRTLGVCVKSTNEQRINPLIRQFAQSQIEQVDPNFQRGHAYPTIDAQTVRKNFFTVTENLTFIGNSERLGMAVEIVKDLFAETVKDAQEHGVWSWDETLQEANLDSSCGVILRSITKCNTKEQVLDDPAASATLRKQVHEKHRSVFGISGKMELLTAKKVTEGKIRTFEISPMHHLLVMMKWGSSFTAAMAARKSKLMSAYGITLQHGGWNTLMAKMNKTYKYVSDVEKWDKHVLGMLLYIVIREILWNIYDNEEWHCVLEKFYEDEMHGLYHLPDGTIIEKTWAQLWNSGTWATTVCNILMHDVVWVYHILRVKGDNRLSMLGELFTCYGDNSLGSSDVREVAEYGERAISYGHFGFKLKKDEDFWSTELKGMKFLGFYDNGGQPLFDRTRILSGLILHDTNRPDPISDISHMFAMVLLAALDTGKYHSEPDFGLFVRRLVEGYLQSCGYDEGTMKMAIGDFWNDGHFAAQSILRSVYTERLPSRSGSVRETVTGWETALINFITPLENLGSCWKHFGAEAILSRPPIL